ncbi:MAG: type II toxin-antitoxin system Phd/YefM family antitoxin [candidate division KSB1 bacterium]|nr:type II toxin-antitoxin system Phd/YefM family antitoxin [candidate division KSB1 bacterium]
MLEFLQRNTITIADLQAKTNKIIAETKRSGQPFLITKDGKPMALLWDVKKFLMTLPPKILPAKLRLVKLILLPEECKI